MKNLKVLVTVMFIVNILGITFAAAQTTGTAYLRPEFEYQKNSNSIIRNFQTAFEKAFGEGDVACFKRGADQTPNKPAPEIVRDELNHLRNSSGNLQITGTEAAELIRDSTTFKIVHADYWVTHESAYIESGSGDTKWWNPLNSSLFKDRTYWVIADVNVNGTIVEFIANCGNPCRVKEGDSNPNEGLEQFPQPAAPAPAQTISYTPPNTGGCRITSFYANPGTINAGQRTTLVWKTDCPYVHIDADATRISGDSRVVGPLYQTTTYTLTASNGTVATATVNVLPFLRLMPPTESHVSATPFIIVGALLLGGGGAYLAFHHSPAANPDHSYSNTQPGYQPGSGQTTTTGGSGTPITLAARWMPSTGLGFMTVTTASGRPKSAIGFHFAIHF